MEEAYSASGKILGSLYRTLYISERDVILLYTVVNKFEVCSVTTIRRVLRFNSHGEMRDS
jgi:hypothetical protein